MYVSVAQQIIREHHESLRREAARVRPAPTAHANRETTPYVVRDLSWELARFLDADGASGNPPHPE